MTCDCTTTFSTRERGERQRTLCPFTPSTNPRKSSHRDFKTAMQCGNNTTSYVSSRLGVCLYLEEGPRPGAIALLTRSVFGAEEHNFHGCCATAPYLFRTQFLAREAWDHCQTPLHRTQLSEHAQRGRRSVGRWENRESWRSVNIALVKVKEDMGVSSAVEQNPSQ